MYHKIKRNHADKLTVEFAAFRKQMEYLKKKKYSPITFKELHSFINNNCTLPDNPVILTFDDGYLNNYNFAAPILNEYNFKYTIFIVPSLIGKKNNWDESSEEIMDIEHLIELQNKNAEFGLHSFQHNNLKDMSPEFFEKDLIDSINFLKENNIFYAPVIAYPFGSFPEDDRNILFKNILKKHNIYFGLKIKSKINKIPIHDPYELSRINVKGVDSFFEFKIKLKKGKAKLF